MPEDTENDNPGAARPAAHIDSVYGLYRDYVVHEDELINQRLTLLATSQSIILAAFGYVLQKMVDNMPPFRELPKGLDCLQWRHYQFYAFLWLLLLAGFGVLLATRSYFSIKAAKLAIDALKCRWEVVAGKLDPRGVSIPSVDDQGSASKITEWEHSYLPALIGGGAKRAHDLGLQMPQTLPVLFLILWPVAVALVVGHTVWEGSSACAADGIVHLPAP